MEPKNEEFKEEEGLETENTTQENKRQGQKGKEMFDETIFSPKTDIKALNSVAPWIKETLKREIIKAKKFEQLYNETHQKLDSHILETQEWKKTFEENSKSKLSALDSEMKALREELKHTIEIAKTEKVCIVHI